MDTTNAKKYELRFKAAKNALMEISARYTSDARTLHDKFLSECRKVPDYQLFAKHYNFESADMVFESITDLFDIFKCQTSLATMFYPRNDPKGQIIRITTEESEYLTYCARNMLSIVSPSDFTEETYNRIKQMSSGVFPGFVQVVAQAPNCASKPDEMTF